MEGTSDDLRAIRARTRYRCVMARISAALVGADGKTGGHIAYYIEAQTLTCLVYQ